MQGIRLSATYYVKWRKDQQIKTYDELKALAEATENITLQAVIKIVDEYKEKTPAHVDSIRSAISKSAALPMSEVIALSTAHSAKGLDWTAIRLEDDFQINMNDEINVLYVAATRAKRLLHPNKHLRSV